jgi:protease IV
MNFFKIFFASLLASVVGFFVIVFFGFVFIIALAAGMSSKEDVKVEPNTVLHLNLDYMIKEKTSADPFEDFDFSSFEPSQNLGLNDILKNIKKAKTDDNIKGIFLDVAMMPNGAATTEAIRNQLLDFKTSGKFIVAYAEVMTNKAFYLASVADKVYLNPYGVVEFSGLNSQLLFLKNMLEKLNIEVQVFYAGKYKSATEPFRYEKMSEPNREQVTAYLNGMYEHYLKKIAESRNISVQELDNIADNLLVRRAEDAKTYKLVDELAYYDVVLDDLKSRTGKKEDEKIASITIKKYDKAPDSKKKEYFKSDKLAVVYAEGGIVDGKGDHNNIGSERVAKLLRKIRQDKDVKALVLRVNSPGGSALASEIILREMELLKKKMPVIVSMGNVAASGGYYISCYADTIVAQPNTITGSIGVFGLIPNMQGFFNKHLGITFDNVKTGKYSDLGTMVKPLNVEEKMIIQQSVDTIYYKFKARVATGRGMSMALVDSFAQGRVWTGEQAKEIGLVDVLGGIDEAIAIAAHKAGITEYRTKEYPEKEDPFEKFLKSLTGEAETYFMKMKLGEFYPIWKQVESLKNVRGIQARMPFDMEVH